MFDIGWDEMLFTAVVAIIVIGPKDMPRALRTAGRWVGKMRRISGHFRAGVENMIREAEMQEMQDNWRKQNEEIMRAHPDADPYPDPAPGTVEPAGVSAETAVERQRETAPVPMDDGQPQLPLSRS
ncbi:MAG: Sec-independent protein translocase protein TatB [Novosphingobium sp.]|nr:Sec-independent protein translocase protein TatB [Novosphingobium sp.]